MSIMCLYKHKIKTLKINPLNTSNTVFPFLQNDYAGKHEIILG
jgi:hypothetical protein